jgi:hypothetical protein
MPRATQKGADRVSELRAFFPGLLLRPPLANAGEYKRREAAHPNYRNGMSIICLPEIDEQVNRMPPSAVTTPAAPATLRLLRPPGADLAAS